MQVKHRAASRPVLAIPGFSATSLSRGLAIDWHFLLQRFLTVFLRGPIVGWSNERGPSSIGSTSHQLRLGVGRWVQLPNRWVVPRKFLTALPGVPFKRVGDQPSVTALLLFRSGSEGFFTLSPACWTQFTYHWWMYTLSPPNTRLKLMSPGTISRIPSLALAGGLPYYTVDRQHARQLSDGGRERHSEHYTPNRRGRPEALTLTRPSQRRLREEVLQ